MLDSSISIVKTIKSELTVVGLEDLQISFGDTPSCAVIDSFPPTIDEMRPGNYVFFDVMQLRIGNCTESEIAIGVACPIISIRESRSQIVIYGLVALVKPDYSWGEFLPNSSVVALSQEHGIIQLPKKL